MVNDGIFTSCTVFFILISSKQSLYVIYKNLLILATKYISLLFVISKYLMLIGSSKAWAYNFNVLDLLVS